MPGFFQDDVGTIIEVNVGEDVSLATTLELRIRKPNGAVENWTAAKDSLVDTQINYTVVAGDFDQAGEYRLNSYIVLPTWTGHGEPARFEIGAPGGP
jgi:hypothetical protein